MSSQPRVGIGVIVMNGGKVLCGKRKSSNGGGSWGFLGGHLEFGESWEECARRETLEESNISIKNVRFVGVTNDINHESGSHYVTIFLQADYDAGDVTVLEPDKFECFEWRDWNTDLPSPLFLPIINLQKQGYSPF